jgi:hypothetical protein
VSVINLIHCWFLLVIFKQGFWQNYSENSKFVCMNNVLNISVIIALLLSTKKGSVGS